MLTEHFKSQVLFDSIYNFVLVDFVDDNATDTSLIT